MSEELNIDELKEFLGQDYPVQQDGDPVLIGQNDDSQDENTLENLYIKVAEESGFTGASGIDGNLLWFEFLAFRTAGFEDEEGSSNSDGSKKFKIREYADSVPMRVVVMPMGEKFARCWIEETDQDGRWYPFNSEETLDVSGLPLLLPSTRYIYEHIDIGGLVHFRKLFPAWVDFFSDPKASEVDIQRKGVELEGILLDIDQDIIPAEDMPD